MPVSRHTPTKQPTSLYDAPAPPAWKSTDGSQCSRAVKTFRILSFAAAGMAVLIAFLPAVGHDQLWCLYVAQRMLAGTRLYGPEILESNPPLIMWLLTPLAALSGRLGIPVTVLFKAGVALLGFATAFVSFRLLRRLVPSLSRAELWGLLFAFLCTFFVMPARDLGQREHLLALLVLPYLVAAALRLSIIEVSLSAPSASLIGIAAGLGLALKPHHLLVPVVIEAALMLRRRSLKTLLRLEPWAILLTCVLYVSAIRIFTPAYLTDILPILRDTYWAIGHLSLTQLLGEAIELHLLLAAVLVLAFLLRHLRLHNSTAESADPANTADQSLRSLATLLILTGLASTVAYYLQGTGWYYQQLPALSFLALALTLECVRLVRRHPVTPYRRLPAFAASLSAVALILTTHFTGYPFTPDRSFPIDLPDPTLFSGLPPGTPVATLTTMVDASIPPVAKFHLFWAQRTNNLWILPAILRNEDPQGQRPLRTIPPDRLAALDRAQHAFMTEDLDRWHPRVVLVQRCQDPGVQCQILEDRHDDLLAWFSRDPAFRHAWQPYRLLRSSGPFDAYVRDPAAADPSPHPTARRQ